MTSAADLSRRHGQLKKDRGTLDSHLMEIAERFLPRQNEFFNVSPTPGAKRTENLYDSSGPIALGKFAAVMESLNTPRTQTWHKLKARSEAIKDSQSVKLWFERQNKTLFGARYSPRANFASQAHEGYMGLGAFGTNAMFIDKSPMGPMRYKSCHIAGTYIAENAWGVIDTVHREFKMAARQLVQKFDRSRLPTKVLLAADKQPDQEFTVVHCVYPNADRQMGKRDYTGMAFAERYLLLEEQAIVEEGGYRTFPYAISRYVTAPSEVYGRSPAMDALPDAKILNEATKVTHRQWHQALEPPWLVADEGVLSVLSTRPGAKNIGGVDENGRPRVLPMISGARFDVSEELRAEKRATIDDVFLVRILQVILDNPTMTATQVLEIAQQKGVLLAPVMGRQQSEFLGPMIEREFDLLSEAGLIEEPPEELLLNGGEYDIEYESPLALAQKAQAGLGVMRTIEAIMPLSEIKPEVLDLINWDEAVKAVGDSNGMLEKVWNSEEMVDAIRSQRADQQAAQTAMEAGPAMAGTINQLAQAKKAVSAPAAA